MEGRGGEARTGQTRAEQAVTAKSWINVAPAREGGWRWTVETAWKCGGFSEKNEALSRSLRTQASRTGRCGRVRDRHVSRQRFGLSTSRWAPTVGARANRKSLFWKQPIKRCLYAKYPDVRFLALLTRCAPQAHIGACGENFLPRRCRSAPAPARIARGRRPRPTRCGGRRCRCRACRAPLPAATLPAAPLPAVALIRLIRATPPKGGSGRIRGLQSSADGGGVLPSPPLPLAVLRTQAGTPS